MRATVKSLGIDRLSIEDRAHLAEEIWESIEAEESASDIPEWHKQILDERLAESETNPVEGVSWEEAKARIINGTARSGE